MTTAEGGAICLNLPPAFDPELLYKQLNTKSLHGQNKDALAKFGKNSWEYDVLEAGYKFNMPDILAAIGLVEIKRYTSDTLKKRRTIFDFFHQKLSNYAWAELPIYDTPEKTSSFHLFLLRIKDISIDQRNAMIQRIFEKGVSVNVHYKPLSELTLYRNLGYDSNDFPVAMDAFHREISLPVFYDLTNEDMQRVVDTIVEVVEDLVILKQ